MGRAAQATPAERKGMDADIFCGPGRTFPIEDQGDVNAAVALIGKAARATAVRACVIGKARQNGWTIPDSWKEGNFTNDNTDTAPPDGATALRALTEFQSGGTLSEDGQWVTKRGVIFAAGTYPRQGMTATPEDLYLAALDFTPVKNRVNHPSGKDRAPSYFDDNLGELTAVELSEDGDTLIGTVRIPKWFDDYHKTHFPGEPIKNSLEFIPSTKRIFGNVLIPNPQIEASALFGAFSAAGRFAGARHSAADMQLLQDTKAKADELTGLFGDLGVGEASDDDANKQDGGDGADSEFAGKRHGARDQALIQRGHGIAHEIAGRFIQLGATPAEGSPEEEAGESPATEAGETAAGFSRGGTHVADKGKEPTRLEKFWAWMGGEGEESGVNFSADGGGGEAVSAPPARKVPDIQVAPKPDPEKELLRRQVEALQQKDIERDAANFAKDMIDGNRAKPAERDNIIAAFTLAAKDDMRHGVVTFSDGANETETSRVEILKAQYANRSPHLLTEEQLKDPEFVALFNRVKTPTRTEEEMSEERRKKLLSKTALGQTAIRADVKK